MEGDNAQEIKPSADAGTALCDHIKKQGFHCRLFSDITVVFHGKEYPLHKIILSQSHYFHSLLSGPWRENGKNRIELQIDDPMVTTEGLECAFSFMYGMSPTFTADNVVSILAAGFFLGLENLCENSVQFALSDLKVDTFACYNQLAEKHCYGRFAQSVGNACWSLLCTHASRELLHHLSKLSLEVSSFPCFSFFGFVIVTYTGILKACGITQDADMGEKIHGEIASQGLLGKDIALGNALVDMYAKCGIFQKAQKVLEELPVQNSVSWIALIAGYAQQGQGKEEALSCFHRMQSEGISLDEITYASILQVCSTTQDVVMGKEIHDEIASQGLLKNNVVLGNVLVDMYAKCGVLVEARKVLDGLPVRNVVSWSALIAGYAQQGQGEEALVCFQQMQSEGVSPDAITYACILKACGITQNIDMGKRIHDDIVSQGLLKKNVVLGTALIDMHAKCGAIQKAQIVLDELLVRNVVSWNALIAGYVQQGQGEKALGCFQRMLREGISPNAVTYACILNACGTTQDSDMGKKIHDDIVSQGLVRREEVLGNALVKMYAKCGVLKSPDPRYLHNNSEKMLLFFCCVVPRY